MAKPVAEFRYGLIKIRLWRRRSKRGGYSLGVVRLYRNGDEWKESTRFGRDDIPVLRMALDKAYAWILAQEAAEA